MNWLASDLSFFLSLHFLAKKKFQWLLVSSDILWLDHPVIHSDHFLVSFSSFLPFDMKMIWITLKVCINKENINHVMLNAFEFMDFFFCKTLLSVLFNCIKTRNTSDDAKEKSLSSLCRVFLFILFPFFSSSSFISLSPRNIFWIFKITTSWRLAIKIYVRYVPCNQSRFNE